MDKRLGWAFIFSSLLFVIFSRLHILPFVAYINIPIIAALVILGIMVLVFGKDALHEVDKLEGQELEPDYYLKKFAPVWKRYMLHVKISIVVWIALVALQFIIHDFGEHQSELMMVCLLGPFFYILALPFIVNLRCPKCHNHIFPWYISRVFWLRGAPRPFIFEFYGQCPFCEVELKKGLII